LVLPGILVGILLSVLPVQRAFSRRQLATAACCSAGSDAGHLLLRIQFEVLYLYAGYQV
jgi:hypothetical protein